MATVPLGKAFGKLGQSCGGAYFKTAKTVIEKVKTYYAKLSLRKNSDIDEKDGNSCQHCDHRIKEEECTIFDYLIYLEKNLSISEKI